MSTRLQPIVYVGVSLARLHACVVTLEQREDRDRRDEDERAERQRRDGDGTPALHIGFLLRARRVTLRLKARPPFEHGVREDVVEDLKRSTCRGRVACDRTQDAALREPRQ